MKKVVVRSVPLDFIKFQPVNLRLPVLAPTLSNSLAVWDRVQNSHNLILLFHPLAHLFNNPEFPLGLDPEAF